MVLLPSSVSSRLANMWSVSGTVFILGLSLGWVSGQFLNNRPFPTYSLENMPDTSFTCRDKILGGYYADSEAQCQMFHICVKVAGVGVQDFRFLCPNGTAFDQDHQICAEWDDVDCDATTLYYASDNFDLYRLGSGYESKAVKYGEDEETFSLQRAETGDARLNREHQANRVNQQKELNSAGRYNKNFQSQIRSSNTNNNNNNDREIFRSSSSSNFFNNRNGGKEVEDEEEDDNVNANQNRDQEQKRKLVRKQQRRPQNNNNNNNNYNAQNVEAQTNRPQRPTGFTNNFAGSSYIPTTTRPTTIAENNEAQYNNNNHRGRGHQRQRVNNDRQYNNADNFRQNNARNFDNTNKQSSGQTPAYTVSTPAPFRQTQQINNKPTTQFNSNKEASSITTPAPKTTNTKHAETYPSTPQFPSRPVSPQTDNYPSTFSQQNRQTSSQPKQTENNYPSTASQQTKQTKTAVNFPTTAAVNNNKNTQYNVDYDVPKIKQTKQENFPTSGQQSSFETKKPTTPFKQAESFPTTFPPKNANSKSTQYNSQKTDNYPTTFAPRTNAAYTQISQQSSQFNSKQTQKYNTQNTHQQPSSQFVAPSSSNHQSNTPRTSPFTQYTPTVPKITTPYTPSTTPVSRSNRFDETQYDDGSYNSKYDNFDNKGHDDEFLKTAHSTNIASSRNEYSQSTKNQATSTQKPRPFSVSPNTPKTTDHPKTTPNTKSASKAVETKKPGKNEKNASYDYAYYDSNVGSEPSEYDVDTEFGKSQKSKKQ